MDGLDDAGGVGTVDCTERGAGDDEALDAAGVDPVAERSPGVYVGSGPVRLGAGLAATGVAGWGWGVTLERTGVVYAAAWVAAASPESRGGLGGVVLRLVVRLDWRRQERRDLGDDCCRAATHGADGGAA